jgi:hypothetical protein
MYQIGIAYYEITIHLSLPRIWHALSGGLLPHSSGVEEDSMYKSALLHSMYRMPSYYGGYNLQCKHLKNTPE